MLTYWCHQIFSGLLANGHLPGVYLMRVCQMRKVIMRRNRDLYSGILAFTLKVRRTSQKTGQTRLHTYNTTHIIIKDTALNESLKIYN